jgi:DNA-directed RNA polymerase specialized sigma24 family protein
LLWYQELTQAEAAAVLGVSEREVRRRWRSARELLRHALPDEPRQG